MHKPFNLHRCVAHGKRFHINLHMPSSASTVGDIAALPVVPLLWSYMDALPSTRLIFRSSTLDLPPYGRAGSRCEPCCRSKAAFTARRRFTSRRHNKRSPAAHIISTISTSTQEAQFYLHIKSRIGRIFIRTTGILEMRHHSGSVHLCQLTSAR